MKNLINISIFSAILFIAGIILAYYYNNSMCGNVSDFLLYVASVVMINAPVTGFAIYSHKKHTDEIDNLKNLLINKQ